jgi:uncharacterized membrane protein/protein-disulfide isomerase
MSGAPRRWPATVALLASLLGLTFGGLSTLDYSKHLDRQVHDIHCSFIPGLPAEHTGESACRAAMYSPYAALFRDRYWGGVPISLFAVGAFSFFAAFALYLLLAGSNAPRRAMQFFGAVSLTPLVVSIVMFTISALKLGQFCKTCVGIYISSALLAAAGVGLLLESRRASGAPAGGDKPEGEGAKVAPQKPSGPAALILIPAWLLTLGIFSVTPALLYVSALPSYANYINSCGKLPKPGDPNNTLIHVTPAGAKQAATLFVDPLCPTCKAFHKRLVADGLIDQLDATIVLFPLDNECNWMLDRPLHPGACLVSKAVLCGGPRSIAVLEWAYDNQERIAEAAKSGAGMVNVRAMLREQWSSLDACIDAKDTKLRLDKMLRYIVDNQLPVSTPQFFLGDTRLCEEDSDIGFSYAIGKLAPNLVAK